MKILCTGSAGFVGSHLIPLLKGHELILPRSFDYDLREQSVVRRLFGNTTPDVVIHLAAHVGGIGLNQIAPAELFYDNAIMGIMLMNEAYHTGVKKFIQVGTICAYPKNTPTPFKEEYLWNGYPEDTNAPYGLAKKMLLVQAQAYRKQYGFNAVYLLPVNLYGPGDNFKECSSHVIPALIKKFVDAQKKKQSTVIVWGTGVPTREFLHVEDMARAIVMVMEKYDGLEPVNIGSGNEISIRDLSMLIKEKVGYEGKVIFDSSKPDGQPRRKLDVSRAKKFFGFTSEINFDKGLTETIQWYKKSIGLT
jgi:GDP-L-fucose synthase